MNGLVARLLTDLTASMRFAGDLNVDLNEITTNLVPFPRLHYLLSSISPLTTREGMSANGGRPIRPTDAPSDPRPKRVAQMFSDAMSSSNMLMRADPRFVPLKDYTFACRNDVTELASPIPYPLTRMHSSIMQESQIFGVRLARARASGCLGCQRQHSANCCRAGYGPLEPRRVQDWAVLCTTYGRQSLSSVSL